LKLCKFRKNKSTLVVATKDNEKNKKIWKTAVSVGNYCGRIYHGLHPWDGVGSYLFPLHCFDSFGKRVHLMEFMHLGEEAKPLFLSIIVTFDFP